MRLSKVRCPECGARMVLRETEKYRYPKSGEPRKFFGCSKYPDCKGTHGAHPDGKPLGKPANAETKQARIAAHAAFGKWRDRHGLRKSEGYKHLAAMLDVPGHEAHIGQMDKKTCEAVVGLCNQGHEVG